ncbi:hypothetical protein Poli38472_008113 [Pythium oligandrum]|uniref:Protochlorophyllide reductase n=1 Tax=Pythium oligandrum TaxID=41045 RepID=A0A8K1CMP7_PYTOL|nr:hypothetical protein Poli38472_008113 [Pythium oligandrum]|eukprot:TMW65471.1 hypothetical protein Poli38472_008113 [Pythium oligandrum]
MTATKVFLVTGATSGIGLECARTLAKIPNAHVIVAGRNQQRVDDAVADIKIAASRNTVVEGGVVDVSSLQSVRNFADTLLQRNLQIFSLVCNAGIQVTKQSHTVDGFESTIGTNHIGHFLLVKLLQDRTKRVITLSSETHDPAERTGLPAPNVSDLDQMAKGYAKFNPQEAYTTSKLCNLLHAKEMARRFPNGPEAIAYSPGLTPDTGLFREQPKVVLKIFMFVLRIVYWFRGERMSTSVYSGAYLAGIAAADALEAKGWHNGDYLSIDRVVNASDQACDKSLGKALWDKSEVWVRPFAK